MITHHHTTDRMFTAIKRSEGKRMNVPPEQRVKQHQRECTGTEEQNKGRSQRIPAVRHRMAPSNDCKQSRPPATKSAWDYQRNRGNRQTVIM
jgi:hypothetical protein